MSEALIAAVREVFSPSILLTVLAAAVYGVFIGAVPGLTATMGVALVVPLTYFMSPVAAIAAVVTLVACAIFSGDIPTTLLRIPGTPASAAYVDDTYAYTRRGQADRALGICLVFSVVGGLFGVVLLALFARPLAAFASRFSVIEYFWLYLLGLSCAVVVSRGSNLKSALALAIGLLLSTVGLSAVHTSARFTFGQAELYQGINFIPAMIGLFGFSEIVRNVIAPPAASVAATPVANEQSEGWVRRYVLRPVGRVFEGTLPLMWRRKWHALRSGGIGAIIGMLPGAGADIAAWVSLAASRRWSKRPDEYGKGSLDGVADATFANSASLAGAWVPALVFGIPGDSVTAIVIGVLLMKNVTPGPEIFSKQAELVYSIYLMFLLANLVLVPVGLAAIKAGTYLVRMPRQVLLPIILLFCVLGAYAINGSYFDVGVMAAMGVAGFALERWGVPLGPVVLGIILGGPLEERFIQTLSAAGGSPWAFFSRPIAAALGLFTVVVWILPLLSGWRARVRRRAAR